MATQYVPIYPPEFGIFTHKFMPIDLDWSKREVNGWRWEDKAYAALAKLTPPDAYKQPDWLKEGIKFANKEEIVEALLQSDYYVKSAPRDVELALGPDTLRLPGYLSSKPVHIFRYRFAVDRFRSEPGTLDEIAQRWSEELHHRTVREKRMWNVWYDQMNILQNRFRSFWATVCLNDPVKNRCIWHDQAPGFHEMSWRYSLDKEITHGMYEVLRQIQDAEIRHICIKRGEDVKKLDEERKAAAQRWRDELEAKRLAEIAKREEEKRLWEEKMAQEAKEREEKAKKDEMERAAYVATAQMTIQAKIAAFQAASAQLTADLQSGKINAAEYGAQMAGLSKMLQ